MTDRAALRARCDALFQPWSGPGSPGAAVAVVRNGDVVVQACYGMADLAHNVPIGPRTVIRIGSQTKQFTVMLTLLLEAAGKLSLDDDVRRYAPWLPTYPAPVTLRHLASNTGGLRDFLEAMAYGGLAITSLSSRQTARRVLARQQGVNFAPGAEMMYCNSGFFLLSEIVEEVSGRSFNELLAEHITGPLGMAATCLMPRDRQILPGLATHHTRGQDGAWARADWGVTLGGEGGMVSTLEDMLRWQANLAHPTSGMAELVRRMATPVVYAHGTTGQYGLGLAVVPYRGLPTVAHGGTVAGGKSESMRFPQNGFGVVILGNCDEMPTFSLARRIADAALGSDMTPLPDPAGLQRLARAAGFYRLEGGDEVFEIVEHDGAPLFASGRTGIPIEPLGDDRFMPERAIVDLVLSPVDDGFAATLCGVPRRYRRLNATPDGRPAPTGTWHDAASGTTAETGRDQDQGFIRFRSEFGTSTMLLDPLGEDLFLAGSGGGARGARGQPWNFVVRAAEDAIVVTSDRTRGLRLSRA